MRWEELLSAKRCRGGQTRGRNVKSSDLRSEFEKELPSNYWQCFISKTSR